MKEVSTKTLLSDQIITPVSKRPLIPPGIAGVAEIDRELYTFLTGQIDKWQPQLIIVVERKGTAILRALIESEKCPLDWSWTDVISSESVDQMTDEYFLNKRILVFDDMMKTAGHVRHLLEVLSERGVFTSGYDNLRVAVFAVHEACPNELKISIGPISYAWFYRHLSPARYQSIQLQIVEMLQRAGSLMLDTEHIEVRVRLHGSFSKFLNALRRRAKARVFHSSDQRANVTIFYEDDEAHALPAELFPLGTCFSDIVKKCRIVDRGGNEYALIPICFPSIPKGSLEWPINQDQIDLLGKGVQKSDVARFNGAGLLAALQVLRWTLRDLAVLGDNDCAILLPKGTKNAQSTRGYTLAHLQVVFPTLDIERLTQLIAQIEKEASAEGARLRTKKSAAFESPPDEELHVDAVRLLQIIGNIYDQRVLEENLVIDDRGTHYPPGLHLGEIFNIGKGMKWEDVRTSTLCDILIDQAALSTNVEEVEDDDGKLWMKRTFAPAGEVISRILREYTAQRGLPHGF